MTKPRKALSPKQVRGLIKRAGSGRELARRAGVSPGSVSKWKKFGVSEAYAEILKKGLLRAPTKPQYEPRRPRRPASVKLAKLPQPQSDWQDKDEGEDEGDDFSPEERIEAYEDRIRYLESRQAALEWELANAPVVSFESIIQVYRDMAKPPDYDEALGMADDFDMDISEVYDAYYEED